MPRACVIVLDAVGAGALPDAEDYGDEGSDTLGNVARAVGGLDLPSLEALGLGNVEPLDGCPPQPGAPAVAGRLTERSKGKDTTTGHWELMGVVTPQPMPVYPHGFPHDVIDPFGHRTGRGVLGNRPASGTEIIRELGQEHLATGRLILYTSGDSVYQIAAHESIWPPERLWEVCRFARSFLTGKHSIGRVIARPFTGPPGAFVRTANRRDFTVEPAGETWLDRLVAAGKNVFGVGKIVDIFSGRGITSSLHTGSDAEGVRVSIEALRSGDADLVFTNLVDFDSKYGHRNDPAGFAKNLAGLDALVPEALAALGPDDLFVLTADHGCETTDVSTDHTREHVPFLAAGPAFRRDVDLGVRRGFCDLAATAGEWLGVASPRGESALSEILA